jgi:hypothetical protein
MQSSSVKYSGGDFITERILINEAPDHNIRRQYFGEKKNPGLVRAVISRIESYVFI